MIDMTWSEWSPVFFYIAGTLMIGSGIVRAIGNRWAARDDELVDKANGQWRDLREQIRKLKEMKNVD